MNRIDVELVDDVEQIATINQNRERLHCMEMDSLFIDLARREDTRLGVERLRKRTLKEKAEARLHEAQDLAFRRR